MVAALLDAGADVNARGDFGWTPLHRAAVVNTNPAKVAALLDAGANLETRGENGMTPLHRAAFRGNPAVVEALLDAGADIAARDENGDTPFDLAKGNDDLRGTAAYWRLNDARFE